MAVQWDVLGLGCTTLDDLIYVESFPQPDGKTQVTRAEQQCGGLTATALVAAARLGARCAYGGLLGYGPLSRFVEERLAAESIDFGPAVRRADAEPIHSTIIVDTSCHTRSILYHIGGRIGADDELPVADIIRATRVLFIDHYGTVGNIRAAKIARAAGIPVVADFERQNVPHFDEMLELVDHLIISLDFARQLTGTSAAEDAARQLQERTQGTIVITCGGQGCIYLAPDNAVPMRVPAFEVEVVDTTGCGDVFHGAYTATLAEGMDLAQRICFASTAAALKAAHYGGQAGIPTRAEVERFLAKTTKP